jgi:NhaP-type Na+/H+ or K+/H+ antiporter
MSGVVLVALLFIVYSLFSRRLGRSPITGPMLFTAAGLLFGLDVFSSIAPGQVVQVELSAETIQILLEVTLAIVLFADAVAIDYRAVRAEAFLPGRLLGVGLPLTMLLGAGIAYLLFPDVGLWGAAAIAIILAPTDAALGQAVVANEAVPDMVRQGLSVESGLNDGIAVPFLAIAVAGVANELQTATEILTVFVEEIGYAVVVGILVGLVGALAVRAASARGWTGQEGRRVVVVFLAILAYGLADPIGGSGFIAAFVGGLAFGARIRSEFPAICTFSEGVAHLLTMASFFVFGALILLPAVELITWSHVLYAILSLTVVRMVPVALSLAGSSLSAVTVAFIGWFGPRGLASLVFTGTVITQLDDDIALQVLAVTAVTVALSVVLHGVTAWPLSVRYAAWFGAMGSDEEAMAMPESSKVDHMPGRALVRSPHPPMSGGAG